MAGHLTKQTLQLELGPVDQRSGNKHVVPGRLVEAFNVRRDQDKILRKRDGFDSTPRTKMGGGSITVGQELASDGRSLMQLAHDGIYLLDDVSSLWNPRGAHVRVTGSYTDTVLDPRRTYTGATAIAATGGYLWLFFAGTGNQYMVIEEATGAVVRDLATLSGAAGTIFQRAVVAGGFVWCFVRETTTTLVLYKFDPALPLGTPSSTTYLTITGSTILNFDVLPTTGNVAVGVISAAAMATPVAGATVIVSSLSTATGLPTGAWVNCSAAVPKAFGGGTPFAWLKHDGSSGNLWFLWQDNGTSAIRRTKINAAGFGGAVTVDWYTPTSTTTVLVTAHRDPAGDLIGFVKDHPAAVETVWENDFLVRVRDNGAVTTAIVARGCTLVSEFFYVTRATADTEWYCVTMHLNFNVQGSQSTYQLRDSNGRIVGKMLYAQGGGFINQTSARNPQQVAQRLPGGQPWFQAGRERLAVLNNVGLATWRFDASVFGSARTYNGGRRVAWPGGWPQRAGSAESSSLELGPTMYPRTFALAQAGGGFLPAAAYSITITYVLVDVDGNVYESAPSPAQTITTAPANQVIQITGVPTYRFTNIAAAAITAAKIRVWCTLGNGADFLLYTTLENDSTLDVLGTITILSEPATYARKLYTSGNVLSNDPPPPFNWCFEFKRRLFLGGTDVRGELWPSHEYLPERGPEFSAVNALVVGAGTGELTAGGVVDDNYACVFRADAIFAISGAGPSRTGGGNYDPQQIEFANGCTNPASVVSGPGGLYYQATDGDFWVVTHTLERVNISRGVDTYRGRQVMSAVYVAAKNVVKFEIIDGITARILTLDPGFPTEDQPFGQWYVDSNTIEPWFVAPPNGACVHGGVYHRLETNGAAARPEVTDQFYDQYDGSQNMIAQKWTAAVSFAGVSGYARLYRGVFTGLWRSAHAVKVTIARDDSDTTPAVHGPAVIAAAPTRVDFRPKEGKGTNWEVTVEETVTGTLGEGFRSESLAFEVGIKRGARRLGSHRRI